MSSNSPRLAAPRRRLARWLADPTLHRKLLLWVMLPQLVLWLAAAVVSFEVAARYAERGIDASLLQATRSLARQVKPLGNGLLIDLPRAAQDIIEVDPEDRWSYMVSTPPGQFILGNRQLPAPPGLATMRQREPVFYDARADDGLLLRVSALLVPLGEPGSTQTMLVQIARSQTNRDELARGILLDIGLPLSLLILLMTAIVHGGIRRGLAPLTALRSQVENRAPNDLAPLSLDGAPVELRSLVKALNDLLAAVGENVAAQRRFIGNAAHQLRTPMAGLKSWSELALEHADPQDAAQRERLERVHAGAVRSARLVQQLLTLSRASPEGTAALTPEPVDLRALAATVTSEAVPRALEAGIDLGLEEPESPAPPGWVAGSELLLREAVGNLVDNAIRYSGAGAVVTVAVQVRDQRVLVSVTDDGPGLDTAQREAAFQRFVRHVETGAGCGLGLPIVREIARRHGGDARLEPVHPRGLRAVIDLPASSRRTDEPGGTRS